MLRVHFLASGVIAAPTMRWLLARSDCDLLSLTTQPDRPQGRGNKVVFSEVKKLALENGVAVRQPEKIRADTAFYRDNPAELLLVMAYGQILPVSLLRTPLTAALNLHASLLPRHRGASCIQAAIREGDAETGVTVMHVERTLDTGPIVCAVRTPIRDDDTGGTLHDRLAELALPALERAWEMALTGEVPGTAQDDSVATYAPTLQRADGQLDFRRNAAELARLIRAYDPWPGAFFDLPGLGRIKCRPPVRVFPLEGRPGDLLPLRDGFARVACAEGTLGIGSLQREGRAALSAADFVRGAGWPADSH